MTRGRRIAGVVMRVGLVLGLLAPAAGCGATGSPPNIILIMVDTLRADYLGMYGFEGRVTPNLDMLAEESVVFRNCFTQSPWTKPAVASMFTSLYPQVHGLTNHEGLYWGHEEEEKEKVRTGVLPDNAVTLAEKLQEAGYRTGAFVSNSWLHADYGFSQGFEVYHDDENALDTTVEMLTDDAQAWLDSLSGDEPYFLYLHFMDTHAPYRAPRSDFEVLAESPSLGDDRPLSDREVPYNRWGNIERRPAWATDEMRHQLSYWRARYASGVRAMDRRLAAFVEYLRGRGDLDDSVIVFTSDHGEELFEHGDWSHGQNLYDHQLHVPLFIRNPGGRHGGTAVDSFVELVDLMPTLVSTARSSSEPSFQGRDLTPWLEGSRGEDLEITFATATQRTPGLFSARTKTHKLIFDVEKKISQLYNLERDPGEQRRALDRDSNRDLRDRLLEHIAETTANGTLTTETAEIPEDVQERLKALGYLE